MSDIISPAQVRSVASAATVTRSGPRGMITLRGDLSSSRLKSVCTGLTGTPFPAAGQAQVDDDGIGDKGILWMSPDEVLLLLPYDTVPNAITAIDKGLKGRHYLAVNVSDARVLMTLAGPYARDVLAKLAPVDLHPDSFGTGDFRRTRLGQVAAAFWCRDAQRFDLICFRAVADYMFDLLATSAKAGPVGHFEG